MNSYQHRRKLSSTQKMENSRWNFKIKFHMKNIIFLVFRSPNFLIVWDHIIVYVDFVPVLCWYNNFLILLILHSVHLSRFKLRQNAYNLVWPRLGHCQKIISTLVVQVESGVRVECVPVTDNEHLCSVRSFYKFENF